MIIDKMTPQQMQFALMILEDIPINDSEEIEEKFLDYPIGTFVEEIWHDFDRRYPQGLKALIDCCRNNRIYVNIEDYDWLLEYLGEK